jgi:hypothetical protein
MLACYLGLWAVTAAAALVCAFAFGAAVRALLGLELSGRAAPSASGREVLALFAHNAPIAAWPLLLAFLVDPSRARPRRLADALVLASAGANAMLVGGAIGAYGAPLLPFLSSLPLEWAALAVGYGVWVRDRRRRIGPAARVTALAAIASAALAAAVLETVAVPRESGPEANRQTHNRLQTGGPSRATIQTGGTHSAQTGALCVDRESWYNIRPVTVDREINEHGCSRRDGAQRRAGR